jgi:uncharacterized protein
VVFSLFSTGHVLRRERIPVLPAGEQPLTILHISDLHLTSREGRTIAWLRSLAELEPDLVISTGDHLAAQDAVPLVFTALSGLLDRPGAFVLGSNDYYAPKLKSPHRYLMSNSGTTGSTSPDVELPWRDLVAGLTEKGWHDLTHQRVIVTADGREIELRGTDDGHLGRDDYSLVAGPARAPLAIGVTHAPYLRLLDSMVSDGLPLILAGHTHGGQWRMPWPGGSKALVTNCDLPTDQARGLSRYRSSWLHVSAGVGASPFAPLRIACPPEVSLLTLVPAELSR